MALCVMDNFPEQLCRRLRKHVLNSKDLKRYRKDYKSIDLWYDQTGPLFQDVVDWTQREIPFIRGMKCLSAWCFLYDAVCDGVPVHADDGKITVNIWLTKNSSILDRNKNGLRIYNVSAPSSWTFEDANGDPERTKSLIRKKRGVCKVVPYSSRRVVVFQSSKFHETDAVHTKKGMYNQRLSCTLIFG